jgi:hypothetical protein
MLPSYTVTVFRTNVKGPGKIGAKRAILAGDLPVRSLTLPAAEKGSGAILFGTSVTCEVSLSQGSVGGRRMGAWRSVSQAVTGEQRPATSDRLWGAKSGTKRLGFFLGVLQLPFLEVGGQLILAGPAHYEVAQHLIGSQRQFASGVQADEHTGDKGAVRLALDAGPTVA